MTRWSKDAGIVGFSFSNLSSYLQKTLYTFDRQGRGEIIEIEKRKKIRKTQKCPSHSYSLSFILNFQLSHSNIWNQFSSLSNDFFLLFLSFTHLLTAFNLIKRLHNALATGALGTLFFFFFCIFLREILSHSLFSLTHTSVSLQLGPRLWELMIRSETKFKGSIEGMQTECCRIMDGEKNGKWLGYVFRCVYVCVCKCEIWFENEISYAWSIWDLVSYAFKYIHTYI